MRNCRLVSLFQAFIPTSGIQPPMPSTCLFSLRLLTLHYDYHFPFPFSVLLVDPCCRRNTTQLILVYSHSPLFFFLKSIIFSSHLGELCTIHSCSLRCFSSFMTRPCIGSRCLLAAAPLITFIEPFHVDQATSSLSRLYFERLFFRTLSYWLPCGAQLPPCLTYSSSRFPFFPLFSFLFASHFCYLPLQSSFIHYSRTGYEDKTAMRRLLLFCLVSVVILVYTD